MDFLTDKDVVVLLRILRHRPVLGIDLMSAMNKLEKRIGVEWRETESVAYAKRNGLPE